MAPVQELLQELPAQELPVQELPVRQAGPVASLSGGCSSSGCCNWLLALRQLGWRLEGLAVLEVEGAVAAPEKWPMLNVRGVCDGVDDDGTCKAAASQPATAPRRCSEARSKDGNLLKGPWAGPKPHAAASLRPPGSQLIRLAGRHLELLSGRPGRDEDPAASG